MIDYREPFMQCFEELQNIFDNYWPEGRDGNGDLSDAQKVLVKWSVLYTEAEEPEYCEASEAKIG